MMKELLHQAEGKTLEFKRDLSSPKPLLKTLVAFANTAGGRLVVGVADDRQVLGVAQVLDEEERLCSLIADGIAPRLVPNVEMITVDGKTLLVVEVFVSGARPHWLKSEGAENGVYVRLGSTSRQADPALIGELRRTAEGVAFDELPMPDLSLDDLDLITAKKLFQGISPLDEQALRTLKLVTAYQGRTVPTKGAVLLFGKERNLHFSDAWVQCGRFVGTDKAHIFDHIDIHEPLPLALDSIMLFLKKHAMRGADFSQTRRQDVWSIPLTLLREAVINALVHADYSQRGAPIRVSFFDDRIEIENSGILLPGMTVEDMRQGVSKIRNHVLARVFKELNLIEQWGSGVRRIFSEAQALGLPEPQILELGLRMRLVVRLAESLQVSTPYPTRAEQVTEQVTEQVKRLLACLKNEPLSTKAVMQQLGLAHRPTFIQTYLQPALQARLIEMTQPDSPKSPTQKYRLKT
jgi:predicted HTH transcriptional regulator